MSVFLKSKLLKSRRIEIKYTRDKLAEGICDVSTLLRYENDTLDPTDEKYELLQNKMKNYKKKYCIPPNKLLDEVIYYKIEKALQLKQMGELKLIQEELQREIKVNSCIELEQFYRRIELLLNKDLLNKESNNSYLHELETLLRSKRQIVRLESHGSL